jgi:outer membrane immunogenic protein
MLMKCKYFVEGPKMKSQLLSTASAAVLAVAMTTPSLAQDMASEWSWYVSLFGGVSMLEDLDSSGGVAAYNLALDEDYDTGFIIGGAIGAEFYETSFGTMRGEVELSFTSNDLSSVSVNNVPYNPGGGTESITVLANVWQDIDLGMPITPFFGGGIGVGFVDANKSATLAAPGVINDSASAFAYQIGTGFRYAMSGSASFEVSYRLRGIAGHDLDLNLGPPVPTIPMDYDNSFSHNIVVGLTYKFPPVSYSP